MSQYHTMIHLYYAELIVWFHDMIPLRGYIIYNEKD